MSAEILREAATKMRDDWSILGRVAFCQCEDSDHWFDRSICPDPCDSMHNICLECSLIKGFCPVEITNSETATRLALSWRAVADWLEVMAEDYAPYWAEPYAAPLVPIIERAYAVARAYLGSDS